MLVVQVLAGLVGDEELGVVGVLPRVGHAEDATTGVPHLDTQAGLFAAPASWMLGFQGV